MKNRISMVRQAKALKTTFAQNIAKLLLRLSIHSTIVAKGALKQMAAKAYLEMIGEQED